MSKERKSYLDFIKYVLMDELSTRNKYWSREDEVADQIRKIREGAFLRDKEIIKAIEERVVSFSGDIWELTEELAKLLHAKNVVLPPTRAMVALIMYIFYTEKPSDLIIIEK